MTLARPGSAKPDAARDGGLDWNTDPLGGIFHDRHPFPLFANSSGG